MTLFAFASVNVVSHGDRLARVSAFVPNARHAPP